MTSPRQRVTSLVKGASGRPRSVGAEQWTVREIVPARAFTAVFTECECWFVKWYSIQIACVFAGVLCDGEVFRKRQDTVNTP